MLYLDTDMCMIVMICSQTHMYRQPQAGPRESRGSVSAVGVLAASRKRLLAGSHFRAAYVVHHLWKKVELESYPLASSGGMS